jgi:hypothetical protein
VRWVKSKVGPAGRFTTGTSTAAETVSRSGGWV